MLENYFHEKAAFVTLTYRDDDLPVSLCSGLPVLEKRDCQLWLKRVRKQLDRAGIRYYLAGEYGTRTHRPHYHAILFGVAPSELDPEWAVYGGRSGGEKGMEKRTTPLSRTWPYGLVHVGEVTRESVQYVAGYVTKKFTKKGDGYVPEFALMSRRPGIGAQAVGEIAAVLQQYSAEEGFQRQLRIDGKKWPLGRFLLAKLSDVLGTEYSSDDYVRSLSRAWGESRRAGVPFVEYLVQQDDGRFARLEARDKIFNHRGGI